MPSNSITIESALSDNAADVLAVGALALLKRCLSCAIVCCASASCFRIASNSADFDESALLFVGIAVDVDDADESGADVDVVVVADDDNDDDVAVAVAADVVDELLIAATTAGGGGLAGVIVGGSAAVAALMALTTALLASSCQTSSTLSCSTLRSSIGCDHCVCFWREVFFVRVRCRVALCLRAIWHRSDRLARHRRTGREICRALLCSPRATLRRRRQST